MPPTLPLHVILIHHPRSFVVSRFEIRAETPEVAFLIAQMLLARIERHDRN